jgi:ABC-type antimicrobial peptide transport system permease subunit
MQPPKKPLAFLRWFCREDYLDEIEGDLTEMFNRKVAASPRRAKWFFAWSVLKYFRPEFIKSVRNYRRSNTYAMFKNYFKVGLRNLVRNNGYSFINIGGLALGMTVTMLIGLWIHDEVSFDKYHKNYDSIGQIWAGGTDQETGEITGSIALQLPMAAILQNNYTRYFKHAVLGWWVGEYILSSDDKKLTKTGEFMEPAGLEMLSLKMLSGSYSSSFRDPHSIILSKSTAQAMFGDEDPINKSLKINNRIEVKVTGIYEDIPKNNRFSEVQFFAPWEIWYSSNDWIKENITNWGNRSFNIYVQLQPNVTMDEANRGINDFFYKNLPKDFLKEVVKYKPYAQVVPMSTWHLYSEFKEGKPAGGRITFVWLFGIVGIFVLMLACINFINLSTARSEKRAREVGVRKSVGSGRGQLVFQFLSESFLVVVLAFIVSLLFLIIAQPWFNDLADKDISLPFANLTFWLIMISFVLITGFMAGLYPAFYLSSFQPVKVLKGTMRFGRLASLPRKVLVIVQFTVSVVLIVGTVIVYKQIQYARSRPVGYDRNGLITVAMNDPSYSEKNEVLRTELLNTGVVDETGYSSSPVTSVWNNIGGYTWKDCDPEKDNDFAIMNVSTDFGKAVSWQLVEGRDFSRDFASDSVAVIINETAAKYMALKEPTSELIGNEYAGTKKWKIIGVVKDLVMDSPYEPVKRTLFFLDYNYSASSQIEIKIKPSISAVEATHKIEAVFRKLVPSASFDFRFVDAQYALKFSQEQRIGKLAGVFAVLAIIISCLGLFGLASFVAERRTKEIGIRKVLGASVGNLWRMLSSDFVVLVIISCFVAIPISYSLMNQWLLKYNYHTEISWWIFIITSVGAMSITLLTVSLQAVKAALMNPVKSLRSE